MDETVGQVMGQCKDLSELRKEVHEHCLLKGVCK